MVADRYTKNREFKDESTMLNEIKISHIGDDQNMRVKIFKTSAMQPTSSST